MMRSPVHRMAFRGPRVRAGLLFVVLSGLAACESESVFEGEPTVAPPVVEFDASATSTRAIHGGQLRIGLTATDPFVGVDSVVVRYTGALQGSFTRRFPGAPAQVRIDTVFAVPFGTQGQVVFEAFALNRFGALTSPDSSVTLIVREDTIRPTPTLQVPALPARVEAADSLSFRVQAQDDAFGSGIARVGIVIRDAGTAAPQTFSFVLPAAQATVDHTFRIPVAALPGPATARQRNLTVVAFAVDQSGNCTVIGASGATAACTTVDPATVTLAGAAATTEVTATRTSASTAATGAAIGDMAVDVARRLVYVTNTANNSVDAFSWTTPTVNRTSRAFVGAAPLGMTMENGGQRLIVANSGGTSLSYVNIGTGGLSETSRFETPNAALYQLTGTLSFDTIVVEIGGVPTAVEVKVTSILTEHDDFSDRPQYLAQDAMGVVFYSTVPTSGSPKGAVRKVENYPNATAPEASILLPTQVVEDNAMGPGVPPKECYEALPDPTGRRANLLPCVIANVDSLKITYESPFLGTVYDVYDHVPGQPANMIHFRSANLYEIATALRAAGSDIFIYFGEWKFDYWLSEGPNTFVTSSGDRSSVNFAEQQAGRVWHWNASTNPIPLHSRFISSFVNIEDYQNNASSQITSASANHDGKLFATRSNTGVFFFTNPLRLSGSYTGADIANGVGVALHPDAAGGFVADNKVNWAAVGSADAEIILVDTRNYRRVGRIALIEAVGGPLRVSRAIPGLDAADVVAHIFGVTKSGRVFEVPVRTTDINP